MFAKIGDFNIGTPDDDGLAKWADFESPMFVSRQNTPFGVFVLFRFLKIAVVQKIAWRKFFYAKLFLPCHKAMLIAYLNCVARSSINSLRATFLDAAAQGRSCKIGRAHV